MRYNDLSSTFLRDPPFWRSPLAAAPAEEKQLFKAVYHGSGTFTITKPKRKEHKKRQTKVKNPQRGARR